ncbi:acyltransferase [Pelotomaculum propionicicum]|uniref:acyltransferase n=1 Tax=Pelotomaculum propionicicum TaxID=258475 RepID=UPI003B7E62B7
MNKFKAIIKVACNFIRIVILRIIYGSKINVALIQMFSITTSINVEKGSLNIGEKVTTYPYVHLSAAEEGILDIGRRTFFNRHCTVVARKYIHIGEKCLFGPNVCIYDHDHRFDSKIIYSDEYVTGKIVIGDRCWIGANVIILRGTELGDDCIVGSGTILKGHYPSGTMIKSDANITVSSIKEMG